jgi:hypothetical protein
MWNGDVRLYLQMEPLSLRSNPVVRSANTFGVRPRSCRFGLRKQSFRPGSRPSSGAVCQECDMAILAMLGHGQDARGTIADASPPKLHAYPRPTHLECSQALGDEVILNWLWGLEGRNGGSFAAALQMVGSFCNVKLGLAGQRFRRAALAARNGRAVRAGLGMVQKRANLFGHFQA